MRTPSSTNDPVFILAPPHSSSSRLCQMLGQHPELFGVPELNLFVAVDAKEFWDGPPDDGRPRLPNTDLRRAGLLRTVAQLYAGEQTVTSVEMAGRWLSACFNQTVGEVYRELCRRVSPLRIVDNSHAYVARELYLKRLFQAFPNARCIHLVCHPRAQCESILNARDGRLALLMAGSIDQKSGPNPILDPQIHWHDTHVRIIRFLESLPAEQWIRIAGEDYVALPDRELRRICAWLGIAQGDDVLEMMKHPERSPFSCFGPINARLGSDIDYLTAPEFKEGKPGPYNLDESLHWRPDGQSFHPQVVALAHEFGYR